MSCFDEEITAGLADIADEAGRLIQVRRDAITRVFNAVPAVTRVYAQSSESARLQVRERDYIIKADLYRFDVEDSRFPLPGDEITDQGKVYEVAALSDATDCWEWSDRGETHFRIHTREIGGNRR